MIVDPHPIEGDAAHLTIDRVAGVEHVPLQRRRRSDDLEGRARLEDVGDGAVLPNLAARLPKAVRVERGHRGHRQHGTAVGVEDHTHRPTRPVALDGCRELPLKQVLDMGIECQADVLTGLGLGHRQACREHDAGVGIAQHQALGRGAGHHLLVALFQPLETGVVATGKADHLIVITGYGTIESAVEAIKMGAYDYLTKPIVDDEIRLVVQRALQQQSLLRENRVLKQQLAMRYSLDNVLGQDYKMVRVFDLIDTVAETRTTILVTGESGTGKSLIARAVHQRSDRRDKPFVEVSCGAIPETLLESELFGHVKGSFTGAVTDKDGKFKAAEGGTIFLDEINSASPAFQVKLLRVLQEKKYEPVGSNDTVSADVRVVLASNVDLKKEVDEGRFRQDLYYRINVVTVEIPSLAERLGDIPLLTAGFLKKYRAEVRKEVLDFTPEAMQALQRYHWPGNVRELENAVERAVVLCKGRHITPDDLPGHVFETPPERQGSGDAGSFTPMSLKLALEDPERRIIEAALRANNWNRQTTM